MTVVLNEQALTTLLDSQFGAVGVDTAHRVSLVQEKALATVSSTYVSRTGSLIRSLKAEISSDTLGLRGRVYCDKDIAPYAIYLEEGTEPHKIGGEEDRTVQLFSTEPNHPDPLVFPQWEVNHPGNRGSHFLRDALVAAAR